jgi:hypothetical protein
VAGVRGVAGHSRDAVDDVTEKAGKVGRDARDVLSTGRDAALQRAERVARRDGAKGTADSVHSTRRELGSLTAAELPIDGYDELGVQDAIKQIKSLNSSEDIRAIVRFEETHKNRANVVSAAQTRLAAIAKEVAGVS